jgi:hypothetical protein
MHAVLSCAHVFVLPMYIHMCVEVYACMQQSQCTCMHVCPHGTPYTYTRACAYTHERTHEPTHTDPHPHPHPHPHTHRKIVQQSSSNLTLDCPTCCSPLKLQKAYNLRASLKNARIIVTPGTPRHTAEHYLGLSHNHLVLNNGKRGGYTGLFDQLKLLVPAWVFDSVDARVKMDAEGPYLSELAGHSLRLKTVKTHDSDSESVDSSAETVTF